MPEGPLELRSEYSAIEQETKSASRASRLLVASGPIGLFHLPWTAGQLAGKAEQFHVRIFPYSSKTGFQEPSGLNLSILINSLSVAGPNSFS
jgi:hypothetical protein